MIDAERLLADLKVQVRELEKDLRTNEDDIAKLRVEYDQAYAARRTALDFEATWLPERVTQTAVAWVLATVFVRFCEDNGLIGDAFIAGPGERTIQARERQEAYFQAEENRHKTDREWLEEPFTVMAKSQAAKSLFNERNPMKSIAPTHDAAKALIDFWRKVGPDGQLVHDFVDPEWNTRFLGDLYQDLSEAARKTYALLQTPEFVEDFILKYTLDPAIEEFGLTPEPPQSHPLLPRQLRVIDPACGSGHFLLGAFYRLLQAWEHADPRADKWILISRAMSSVHGVDKNPFAAAIARFRLLLAAMKEGGIAGLDARVDFPIYIAVGDSLLHGAKSHGEQGQLGEEDDETFTYSTEDVASYIKSAQILLWGSYHAVVANPPYITVSDPAENAAYREFYASCYREYSLSVPFAERIFKLAVLGSLEGARAGYTGQITANSFMKREFGKRLIEEFFYNQVDLTHVIDTSGAYLPGFGTPTITIFGRRRFARPASTIRTVLGVRGEPATPVDPSQGVVWRAIVEQVDRPGSESEWVSVRDADRRTLAHHPWSLAGGGAEELRERIERASVGLLGDRVEAIGYGAISGEDDAYFLPATTLSGRFDNADRISVLTGAVIRDYRGTPETISAWPYDSEFRLRMPHEIPTAMRFLWPRRRNLEVRKRFGIPVETIKGFAWYEYREVYPARMRSRLSIACAEVSTHNNFSLNRGGEVFQQSAPVVKLSEGANEDAYFPLLGILNSSAGCFWLKAVCQPKGGSGIGRGVQDEAWEERYVFNTTRLKQFPLPGTLPSELGRQLDLLAQQLAATEPSSVCASSVPTRERLNIARADYERLRGRMIALQEELDWDVYHRYGLLADEDVSDSVADPVLVPELKLGERAFEIALAQRMGKEGIGTHWFSRHHGSKMTLKVPVHWPDEYKAVVARRIEIMTRNRNIGLIERPECKRRWLADAWEVREREALSAWLLDRCEKQELWFGPDSQPRPLTVNRLADILREETAPASVARLLNNDSDADLADVLNGIIHGTHVPYLARLRYKGEGLLKRAQWERTWDLQREEDATGNKLDIPVPPKYKPTDFQKPSYWRNRGKLDVPKERFISYPKAGPDSDDSLLLGWAGWDHREQALALYGLIEERQNVDGWGTDKVKPLIDGLAEVMPWVRQWHNEVDPNFGQSIADILDTYLASQRERHGITL